MWASEYRALCLVNDIPFRVEQTSLKKRNVDVTEYSLVATKDMTIGTFLGFYTGEFSQNVRTSLYAAQLNHVHIYPFPNEDEITLSQRESRPFANMNEPRENTEANCCMILQDFSHDEVEFPTDFDPETVRNARFFRGLACFTCANVRNGDELTWHYGASYEQHRSSVGYKVGHPCRLLVENTAFLPDNSQGVLQVMHRVQFACVIPIYGLSKSPRFPLPKKRKRKNSSESTSSSGSGHIPKYDPTKSNRTDRLNARKRAK